MIRLLTRWLVTRLRAEAAFVVLLAVAGVGAWLYVGCREARAERDRLQHRLTEICARAGSDAATRDGGAACQRHVAALADFRARTDQLTARTLADALAAHDARARADEARARTVTAATQAAAHEMEIADAQPTTRTWSIAAGLLLSTLSPGCAPRPSEPAQVPVAVPVRDRPPAELLACAERPAGLPTDPALTAQLPARLRAGVIRLARAFAANAARLDRLVEWDEPGRCAGGK